MEQTHINKVLLRNVGKLSRIDEREESMMPKVVPSAVMNAVSAAMSIFTAIEIIRDLVIVVAN